MKRLLIIILLFTIYQTTIIYKNNIEKEKQAEYLAKDDLTITKETDIQYILEIPSIKLKENIYKSESKENNVDKHISMLEGSIPIINDNANIMLVGHSGNSPIAFFKRLSEVKYDDEIFLYYSGLKYKFSVIDIYTINKVGTIKMTNYPFKALTLITCIGTEKQLVYVTKLEDTYRY